MCLLQITIKRYVVFFLLQMISKFFDRREIADRNLILLLHLNYKRKNVYRFLLKKQKFKKKNILFEILVTNSWSILFVSIPKKTNLLQKQNKYLFIFTFPNIAGISAFKWLNNYIIQLYIYINIYNNQQPTININ